MKANGQIFEEEIKVGDISGFNLTLTEQKDRAVALVGYHRDGKNMTLFILDESNEIVYKEDFQDTRQVHKIYNFESLKGDKVSFVLYHNDQLIKNQSVKF